MTKLDELKKRSQAKLATHRATTAPLWRRWQKPRWRWLAAPAVVGLVALGVGVYITTDRTASTAGSSLGTASPYNSGPITVHHHALRVTPEQAVASVQVGPRLTAALTKWDTGRGGTALAAVSGDLGDAMQAYGVRLFSPMLQACSSLATAVTAARVGPPIPDTALQVSYAQALAKLATAAADCRAGISQSPTEDQGLQTRENPATIRQAESELAAGTEGLYQATVDINAVRSHGRR
jgi:hypothetical protein